MSSSGDVIPDVLVLAAIDRAERHSLSERSGAARYSIMEHLGLSTRSKEARRVRQRLGEMTADGLVEPVRRGGMDGWVLTPDGRGRLGEAVAAGGLAVLPESPQHRRWRESREKAGRAIERFRERLRVALADAEGLLDANERVHSDAWFELAERLQRSCRRLGRATHWLYEWPEPDDEQAEIDERHESGDEKLSEDELASRRSRRSGRRGYFLDD
jgi:hypothetical protein